MDELELLLRAIQGLTWEGGLLYFVVMQVS
jgi:hypothetical protein